MARQPRSSSPPASPTSGGIVKGQKIGRILIKMGKATRDQIQEALALQKDRRMPLGQLLIELGCHNVHMRVGDGTAGWPEAAPFQAIIITAAAPEVPQPLLDQLAESGRLVAPVGPAGFQNLVLVQRKGKRTSTRNLAPVAFVPLIGEHGWSEKDESGWSWRFWRK